MSQSTSLLLFRILLLLGALAGPSLGGFMERHLIRSLLENYNPLERPVPSEAERLNVTFSVTLQQIIDVDEKNQILVSNLWLNIKWVDINLVWNPAEFNNITSIRLSPDLIWIPDMLLYNSADERFDSTFRTNVVVGHDGSMLYVPPGIFRSTCKIDITWFPFDDQACIMKFGTWTHGGHTIDLIIDTTDGKNESADISAYIDNSEWVLMGVPAVRHEESYDCCPEPFIDITFTVHIKRRTLYYGFNLIIPCIILSSMTLLSFSLPPESGEKLHLGVTILLSMTVFLVQLGKILPATSDSVSIIALYFGSIMVMVAFSVVMTVVVLNFHHRSTETKEMGPLLKAILLNYLPRAIFMDRPGIKLPKQCLHKKPSKTQLIQQSLTASCLGKSKDTDKPETDLPGPCFPRPPEAFGNYVPQANCPTGSGGIELACLGGGGGGPVTSFEDNSMGPPLDALYVQHDFGHPIRPAMDSISRKSANLDFNEDDADDEEEEEEEGPEVLGPEDSGPEMEPGAEDDLDVSISITDSVSEVAKLVKNLEKLKLMAKSKESIKGSIKSAGSGLKKKTTTSTAATPAHDAAHAHQHSPGHRVRHEYMALKRKHKLLEILLEMKFITDRLRKEDETKDIIAEWRYAATVLDRLCLILFTLFTVLSLAICLGSAPQLIV